MAKKLYKTAMGKSIDMEALRLKQEDTLAVGNMRINAKGDEITPTGQVIRSKSDKVKANYYDLHATVPEEGDIPTNKPTTQTQVIADALESVEQVEAVVKDNNQQQESSLASSVAQSQQTTGTPEVKSERQKRRSISGVKRV
jgi:hypothetical protein